MPGGIPPVGGRAGARPAGAGGGSCGRPGARAEVRPPGAEEAARDITRDKVAFTALVRNHIFTFLRTLLNADYESALASMDGTYRSYETYMSHESQGTSPLSDTAPWTTERLRAAMDAYHADHRFLRLDPEARNLRHTYITPSEDARTWAVQQMLFDPDETNDWVAEFAVDLAPSREAGEPVLRLLKLGSLV